jgi:hypothetical protein
MGGFFFAICIILFTIALLKGENSACTSESFKILSGFCLLLKKERKR